MTLQLTHIRHRYDENSVRQPILDVNYFSARSGEQVLIVGASASGKTTLLDILAGRITPTGGSAQVELYGSNMVTQNIGYVPQHIAFVPEMTVLENVALNMTRAGQFPSTLSRIRAKAVLDQLGILTLAHVLPHTLTMSERVRVAIARAIAPMPRIILADEPAANATAAESHFVLDFLREIGRSYNATLIVTTRNPTLASQFESVYYLYRGVLEPLTHLKTRRLAPHQLRQDTALQPA